MIEKPEQYYDTRRHQFYYQWRESEYFSHQEPIYDRTREYIESLEAENVKLRELCAGLLTGYECGYGELCKGCTWDGLDDPKTFSCLPRVKARDLGVEVDG